MQIKHFSVPHSVWWCRLEERSNLPLCLPLMRRSSFHLPVMSSEWCWRKNCTVNTLQICPLFTTLDGKSAWKWDLYFFFFADGDVAVFQNVQKAYVYNVRKDVMVPYECPTWQIIVFISCTVWHHVYYDYLTVTSSVQLPTAVGIAIYRKERSFRGRKIFVRKEAFKYGF